MAMQCQEMLIVGLFTSAKRLLKAHLYITS
jgi:hypothetical protein